LVPIILQIVSLDPFLPLFEQLTLRAHAFYAGTLCVSETFDSEARGYLHVLRAGRLAIDLPNGEPIELSESSLILMPLGTPHRFRPDFEVGAELVCAEIGSWGRQDNPIIRLLPSIIVIPVANVGTIAPTLNLLFEEAFAVHSGRQAALDRLFEYLMIQVLRHAVDQRLIREGVLAGLADARLARALTAMHTEPRRTWLLESLADIAGMSRSRFAVAFRQTLGVTPIDYLNGWRIARAQNLLRQGKAIKLVAEAVGYDSPAAFSRAFSRISGRSPRQWLAESSTISTPPPG